MNNSRDLSKSTKAQKRVENTSKSKFAHINSGDIQSVYKPPMVKLTATVDKSDWDYLQSEAIRRSQERGKILTISQVLREILKGFI